MFLLLCLSFWHLVGVFCDETTEVMRVSVKKGDSVTLHSDFTGTQTYNKMEWRFENERIARIKISIGNKPQYEDERFRDRLKLDNQTGSLTINNMTITDSGVYELSIFTKETFKKKFNVTVNEASIPSMHTVLISAAAVAVSLVIVVAVVIFCICINTDQDIETVQTQITYVYSPFLK